MGVQPAPAPASNEFTVAAYNIERFFNTSSADDIHLDPVSGNTQKSSAVDLTQTAYNNRLAKVSLAIRDVLGSPDIMALEEPENQSVVADIAAKISSDAAAAGEPDPQYVAYGTGTSYAPYTNDIGGISVGFLVKSNVDTLKIEQLGASNVFTDPRDGSTLQTLNDRPPLVLHAGIKRTGAKDYPVTVIVRSRVRMILQAASSSVRKRNCRLSSLRISFRAIRLPGSMSFRSATTMRSSSPTDISTSSPPSRTRTCCRQQRSSSQACLIS
jgi:hypothetical protein